MNKLVQLVLILFPLVIIKLVFRNVEFVIDIKNKTMTLHKVVEEMVHIKDDVSHRSHVNHDVIMQKIYQNAAGYEAEDQRTIMQIT